eukprot:7099574-Prymnesium_polylepis.1
MPEALVVAAAAVVGWQCGGRSRCSRSRKGRNCTKSLTRRRRSFRLNLYHASLRILNRLQSIGLGTVLVVQAAQEGLAVEVVEVVVRVARAGG